MIFSKLGWKYCFMLEQNFLNFWSFWHILFKSAFLRLLSLQFADIIFEDKSEQTIQWCHKGKVLNSHTVGKYLTQRTFLPFFLDSEFMLSKLVAISSWYEGVAINDDYNYGDINANEDDACQWNAVIIMMMMMMAYLIFVISFTLAVFFNHNTLHPIITKKNTQNNNKFPQKV